MYVLHVISDCFYRLILQPVHADYVPLKCNAPINVKPLGGGGGGGWAKAGDLT